MNLIRIKNEVIDCSAVVPRFDLPDPKQLDQLIAPQAFSVYLALGTFDMDENALWKYTQQNKLWNSKLFIMMNAMSLHVEALCLNVTLHKSGDITLFKFDFMPSVEFTPFVFPKPLFVPLHREYFDLFKAGSKTHELRKNGPRWNEKTCVIGRPAVISLGYGKKSRLKARVMDFQVVGAEDLTSAEAGAFLSIFKTLDCEIAKIQLRVQ